MFVLDMATCNCDRCDSVKPSLVSPKTFKLLCKGSQPHPEPAVMQLLWALIYDVVLLYHCY